MGLWRKIAEIFLRRFLAVSIIFRNFALRKSETGTEQARQALFPEHEALRYFALRKTVTTLHLSARGSGAIDNQRVTIVDSFLNSPQLSATLRNSPHRRSCIPIRTTTQRISFQNAQQHKGFHTTNLRKKSDYPFIYEV